MKALRNLLVTLAVIVGVNMALWPKRGPLVDHSAKPEGRLAQRAVYEQYLAKYKPDVVFLGNSMLTEGVDMKSFVKYTNTVTMRLARGGSATAWWYLVLKNVVAETPKKPKLVVIFFRDTFLTIPDYRVNGKYKVTLNDFCNEQEPLLDRLAYLKGMDRPSYLLSKYSPLFQQKDNIRDNIESFIKQNCAGKLLGTDTEQINNATAAVFDRKKMNLNLITARQEAVESGSKEKFQESLEKSFLPYMIDVAQENDIQLAFVRIKRRRDVDPNAEPRYITDYITNLKQYLDSRNTEFIDFTDSPEIKEEHFADGDHLDNKKGAQLFTRMVAEALKPVIQKHVK